MSRWVCRVIFFALVITATVAGCQKWRSHAEEPYVWTRNGDAYVNNYYGLQITKKDGWLRSVEKPSWDFLFFMSRLMNTPASASIFFGKRNQIAFHRFGDRPNPDAIVSMSPVDDLKKLPRGWDAPQKRYAKTSLEIIIANSKMRIRDVDINLMEMNGFPCAKARVSMEIPGGGVLESEQYFFVQQGKGFHLAYSAIPSEFDKYRGEALEIIQSFRFLNK